MFSKYNGLKKQQKYTDDLKLHFSQLFSFYLPLSDLLKSRELSFLPSSVGGARGQILNLEGCFNIRGLNNHVKKHITQKLKIDVQNFLSVKVLISLEHLVFKNFVLPKNLAVYLEKHNY